MGDGPISGGMGQLNSVRAKRPDEGSGPKEPSGGVPYALNTLQSRVTGLQGVYDRLELRVDSVLRDPQPSSAGESSFSQASAESRLAESLAEEAKRLDTLLDKFHTLIDRIDL